MSSILNSERIVQNLPELKQLWEDVLPHLKDCCIILMSGEVGAGKTTSVQMIAQILGMQNVQSPSFAIHLRYENDQGKSLDHVDLYRLKDDDDLESSGFWDLFSQKNALIVIEWANRLNFDYLPMNWQKLVVNFEKISAESRKITLQQI